MRPAIVPRAATLVLLAVSVAHAWADDKADYDKRAVARYTQLFQSLDRNADGVVTREEARGDLNLGLRFDDMDVNRDERLTTGELHGYLERHHGMQRQGAPPASIKGVTTGTRRNGWQHRNACAC
jgi:hypothetical protein